MRVISGKIRGLKLNPPKDQSVRPTTDRVKESLFNIINSYVMDSNVLDLFSGSGSLGIECLSRGAKHCVFSDLSKDSINIIKSNIKKARLESESTVINKDYKNVISEMGIKRNKFDIIMIDPPYYEGLFIDCIERIDNNNILSEDGIIVVEHDKKDELPEQIGNIIKIKEKKYGITILSFYKLDVEDCDE
ncbi:16S rRNA (guanine(966)-N(2))-methyltransferase RsmD [Peptacetobacter sp.]|uniref:16S rRNA (guanine(966)-N(2))-methyltransferase RsmD n=1 Tax=Peptacetobacter sp. TaxID=2991975 RepID=UPI00261BE327|nr:16S rRNA (guanine(966)-N(2))-methyltransferase RsmD [Peptacetobacter sp.]